MDRPTPPASPGMAEHEIATPALIVDLDAFERNLERLAAYVRERGIRLRAHAKTHKSVDVALAQTTRGGACGVCCQKVSEAEVMVDGGINDVLVSNQVTDPAKIDRLAALAARARIIVCVDDARNVADLSAAAVRHGVTLECLVEIDVGAGRCGTLPGAPAAELAGKIANSPGLRFSGLQAYQGSAQHMRDPGERRAKIDAAITMTRETVERLSAEGLDCPIVGGAGTGTYRLEGASGVYNELQCGSYVFMDADYARVPDEAGNGPEFEHALFVLTGVMSTARPGAAVCDAGLKAMSAESGLPVVFGAEDLAVTGISDEHTVIGDPTDRLQLNDRLRLIPGHCDPTCNLHDWYVGVRRGVVECLWPVSARGRIF